MKKARVIPCLDASLTPEQQVTEWLSTGLYLRIARKTKYWAMGLMKGIQEDDLGQIVALGLIVRSRRPNSCYNPARSSVSNYIWMVTASSIMAAVNRQEVRQYCMERDYTSYDLSNHDSHHAFRESLFDSLECRQSHDNILKEDIELSLKLDMDDGILSPEEVKSIQSLLAGESIRTVKCKYRDVSSQWIREHAAV